MRTFDFHSLSPANVLTRGRIRRSNTQKRACAVGAILIQHNARLKTLLSELEQPRASPKAAPQSRVLDQRRLEKGGKVEKSIFRSGAEMTRVEIHGSCIYQVAADQTLSVYLTITRVILQYTG